MYQLKDIKAFLAEGREIEFSIGGILYSFTNLKSGWQYCKGDQIVTSYDSINDLLDNVDDIVINGLTLKHLFNHQVYDESSLYIL